MQQAILYLGNILSTYGFTPTTVETLSPRLKKDFTVYTASNKKSKVLRLLDMLLSIVKLRGEVKVVLIDTYSSSAFMYARICGGLCKMLKIPYIAYLHGGNLPNRFKQSPKSSYNYLKNASRIVCPSGYLQHAVASQFNLSAEVIPNFLDISNYPFLQRTELKALNILWVRSFHEIYRPDWAIKTLAALRNAGAEAKLTMVGPDKDASLEKCKAIAKEYNLEDHVTFTGKLKREEWTELSAKYNLFLSTTSVDNTPVSVMEAMALGMPVVTTKVGGIPYLFFDGEEGVMVSEESPEAFSEAIISMIKVPNVMQKISSNARKKAARWDWQIVRKQWITLLDSI